MKARSFGLTWWGERWIEALETLGATWQNRLPRGRTYARKGTVHGLQIAAGEVTALVDGSRARPYLVEILLPVFDDATWEAIITGLSGQLRHAAALLDGRMPEGVDDTLGILGVSLFPTARQLRTSCSCPDSANPCKHIAAVHYVLATMFDEDPFLLFVLRGRDQDQVMAALRAERAGAAEVAMQAPSTVVIALDDLRASELFGEGAPSVTIDPDHAVDVLAVLHRLGPLPPELATTPADMEAMVRAASEAAWALLTD